MQACKPDSVPQINGTLIIYLGVASLQRSFSLPTRYPAGQDGSGQIDRAYLAFQPARFTMPPLSPMKRWALTPPFHLFPFRKIGSGSLFSVALSVPDESGPSR